MDDSNSHDPRFGRTAPTWEVELLISGVAVFAMLQLPGWLDDRMFALSPRLNDDWRIVVMLSYFYSKSAAVVLAVTFALHLLLRAQWIALVGMHSVYPQGVRWDRLLSKMPPYQARQARTEIPAMEQVVEAADNRATTVFGLGFALAGVVGWAVWQSQPEPVPGLMAQAVSTPQGGAVQVSAEQASSRNSYLQAHRDMMAAEGLERVNLAEPVSGVAR